MGSSNPMVRIDKEFADYLRECKRELYDIPDMSFPKITKKLKKYFPPPKQFRGDFI